MPRRPYYRCPNCKYDVGQTLNDGLGICPECGSEISRAICASRRVLLSTGHWAFILLAWALPALSAIGTLALTRNHRTAMLSAALLLVSLFVVNLYTALRDDRCNGSRCAALITCALAFLYLIVGSSLIVVFWFVFIGPV